MLDAAVAATVFGITFLAELPDKSLFASLLLGTRYRPAHVWTGIAAAFTLHVAIAVTAGQLLLALLPHRAVEAVVAALFMTAAAYLLVASFRPDKREGADAARQGGRPASFSRVVTASFAVAFTAEWGDITQLTMANLAARYADPVSVGVGALLALWALAAIAVNAGAKSLSVIPMAWVRRVTAVILLGLTAYSAFCAITG